MLITPRLGTIAGMIFIAAASRLLPHPPNFAPIGAMALFGGAAFGSLSLAFAVPFTAMLLSDLALGVMFYDLSSALGPMSVLIYGCFAFNVILGHRVRNERTVRSLTLATLTGSAIFFVVTNLGVWLTGGLYPRTHEGLVTCFVAALPFLQNTLLGDAIYTTLLFGVFAIAEGRSPALREHRPILVRS